MIRCLSRTLSLVAILVVAAVLAGPAAASAAPPWSAPSVLGPTGRESGVPEMVVAPDGEAIVAWEGIGPDRILVSTRQPGGAWTAPVTLGPSQESSPQIAVSAGKSVVVWDDTIHTRGDETAVVMAATRIGTKRWSKARNISAEKRWRSEPEGGDPHVAISPGGKAIAIWEASDEGHSTAGFIRSATQAAGGTGWSAPAGLPGSIEGESPEVGATPAGEAVAIWSATYDEESGLEAAVRPAKGKWKRSQRLDRPGSYATPQLTVTPTGEAIGVWVQAPEEEESGSTLQVATRGPGGKWIVKPLAPKDYSTDPSIVDEPGGGVRLFWMVESGGSGELVSSTRSPGGSWSEPASLAAEGLQIPSGSEPAFAVTGAGETVAAWHVNGTRGETTIQAASRPAGGTWSAPSVLSTSPPPPLYGGVDLQLAVTSNDEVLAVWHRFTGKGWTIEAATR